MGEVDIEAAAGIDFEIEKGEFAVIVGSQRRWEDDGAKHPWRYGHGDGGRGAGGRTGYRQV